MFAELGLDVSAVGVAQRYVGLIRGFVMDQQDAALADGVRGLGLEVAVTQTVMRSDADRGSLARDCVDLLRRLGT